MKIPCQSLISSKLFSLNSDSEVTFLLCLLSATEAKFWLVAARSKQWINHDGKMSFFSFRCTLQGFFKIKQTKIKHKLFLHQKGET